MSLMKGALALIALVAIVALSGCGADPAFTSGKVYLADKNYEDAIEQLTLAIENAPDNWEPRMYLGSAYAETGELEMAHDELFQALELAPDEGAESQVENMISYYWQQHNKQGMQYVDAAKYDEAIKEYEKAITIDPRKPDALTGLGVAYQSLGEYDEAIEYFEMAYESAPENETIQENLLTVYDNKARSLGSASQYEEAISYYEQIQEIAPDYPELDFNIGYMHYQMRDYATAIDYYEDYLVENPEDEDVLRMTYYAHFQMGESLWETDQMAATEHYEEAIGALNRLVAIEDDVSYHRTLAKIYNTLGREEEAMLEVEQMRMLLEQQNQ
ncbi:MAG: tetratricopeptide repeat protein [Candidatus Eisenbacteria bacterium]|nr:tetratricopeptide repeat protein [Candidatus Eisenbacteria bacterium]